MGNSDKALVCLGLVIFLSGCRPFQPPPEEFETYFKPGVDSNGVIEQMVRCGYPNARGFVGETDLTYLLRQKYALISACRGRVSKVNPVMVASAHQKKQKKFPPATNDAHLIL
jgi:hypothetical protein